MNGNVSLVLTSCRRADLLEATLDSFFEFNDYPLHQVIVIEDSNEPQVPALVKSRYAGRVRLIVNEPRLGQIRSIDRAYGMLETDYVFHCEDDWRFYRSGFMRESLDVLESDPRVHQVQLRDLWANNGHPPDRARYQSPSGVWYRLVSTDFRAWNGSRWHGFSFNPGLRRIADYRALGSYAAIGHEEQISAAYHRLGLRAAILEESAVEHIGDDRHVNDIHEDAKQFSLRDRAITTAKLLLPPLIPKAVSAVLRKKRR